MTGGGAAKEGKARLVAKRSITRIDAGGRHRVEDLLLREECWTLFCDGAPVSTHHCLPTALRQMAVGRLRWQGLIGSAEEIEDIELREGRREIHVALRPPGKAPAPPPAGEAAFSPGAIHALQKIFNERCELFRRTGAAHSCALADEKEILFYFEDAARHNAMDKLLGEILLRRTGAAGNLLLFSGRLALDMVQKAAATGVKVLVAPGAPTLAAVEAAEGAGLTLLGFVRPGNINIYCGEQRINGF